MNIWRLVWGLFRARSSGDSVDNEATSETRFDMVHGKADISAGQSSSRSEPAMNVENGLEQARTQARTAEPVVPLNVELHQRLSCSGGAKPSTLKSAMSSLERLRKARIAP